MTHPSYRQTAWLAVLILAGPMLAAASAPPQRTQKPATKAAAQAPTVRRYPLTGRVVSIDKPNQSINIDGDAIPGFMAAMTMPYSVKDAAALAKLSPGDRIKAEIVVGDEDAYLENIVVTARAAPRSPAE